MDPYDLEKLKEEVKDLKRQLNEQKEQNKILKAS